MRYTQKYVTANIPGVTVLPTEGTYLMWLDFRALGLTEKELQDLIVNRAKLWLDAGSMFGKEGEGFERINAACPRAILAKALEQLKDAVLGL